MTTKTSGGKAAPRGGAPGRHDAARLMVTTWSCTINMVRDLLHLLPPASCWPRRPAPAPRPGGDHSGHRVLWPQDTTPPPPLTTTQIVSLFSVNSTRSKSCAAGTLQTLQADLYYSRVLHPVRVTEADINTHHTSSSRQHYRVSLTSIRQNSELPCSDVISFRIFLVHKSFGCEKHAFNTGLIFKGWDEEKLTSILIWPYILMLQHDSRSVIGDSVLWGSEFLSFEQQN